MKKEADLSGFSMRSYMTMRHFLPGQSHVTTLSCRSRIFRLILFCDRLCVKICVQLLETSIKFNIFIESTKEQGKSLWAPKVTCVLWKQALSHIIKFGSANPTSATFPRSTSWAWRDPTTRVSNWMVGWATDVMIVIWYTLTKSYPTHFSHQKELTSLGSKWDYMRPQKATIEGWWRPWYQNGGRRSRRGSRGRLWWKKVLLLASCILSQVAPRSISLERASRITFIAWLLIEIFSGVS